MAAATTPTKPAAAVVAGLPPLETQGSSSALASLTSPRAAKRKLTPDDFEFGGMLGEGAYAKVLIGTLKETKEQFAVKIVDKTFVQRHNKVNEMLNEKTVLSMLDHPGIIKLRFTFQDEFSLYYVLELAERGELFSLIQTVGPLPTELVRFFTAELVSVLEYLHTHDIIHRDLKPENILINRAGHLKLTDFATSKQFNRKETLTRRKKSFVGTAEYVSPEILNDQAVTTSGDMWALGCVIYQMLVGKPPFRGASEYLTFQKIMNREFELPDNMDGDAKDLIDRLLQLDPLQRLGADGTVEAYVPIKTHPFFAGIDFDSLFQQQPPCMDVLDSYSKSVRKDSEEKLDEQEEPAPEPASPQSADEKAEADKKAMEKWKVFLLPNEKILCHGLITKRRYMMAKKRYLILTDIPRFLYINPDTMQLRGEIAWSPELWAEMKPDNVFWIHTPNRSYFMKGHAPDSAVWVKEIQRLQAKLKAANGT